MPRLLVFQHVPHEILGTLDPLFRSYGFRIRYVNFGREPQARPDVRGYDGLVVLGGPMNVDQVDRHPHLRTEIELIGEALEVQMPILGICLGSQLLARALGAQVAPSPRTEIGWYDVSPTDAGRGDPLFRHFEPTEKIFQWHGDAFEIPRGAVHLASSPVCNQAFRYGERAYGLQFHLEVDEPLIERWLEVPENREQIAGLAGETSAERIRRETREHVAKAKRLSDRTFAEFAQLFGALRRRDRHPHA